MSKLKELLIEIDKIENDQEFMERESDVIKEYCIEHNFELSEDDMNEIKNRGLDDGFEFWQNEFSSK